MASASDRIIIAWQNLRAVLAQRRVLMPGAVLSASGIFFLDAPVARYQDVSEVRLRILDFSGGSSEHALPVVPAWYKSIEKGISLVDAPLQEVAGVIGWPGIALGTMPREQ